MSFISLQQRDYVSQILNTLKAIAFHQIYMEKQREQLCQNQYYDPLTAFKSLDAFKSGEIIGFQLRGFLGKYNYECTDSQCERVMHSVNKGILRFGYEDFQELTLPNNSVYRNQSLSRYNDIKVQVGTMSTIYEIKSTSALKISAFFIKEIQFDRQLVNRKQHFCQAHGGDLYTFSQIYFKGKQKQIKFDSFYETNRKFNYLFNKDQFRAIFRRIKSQPYFYSTGDNLKMQPILTINLLSNIFLTNDLDVKKKLKIEAQISLTEKLVKQPSYRQPIFQREASQKLQKQYESRMKLVDNLKKKQGNVPPKNIRFNYSRPEMHFLPKNDSQYFRYRQKEWKNDVEKMGSQQIDIRYQIIDGKKYSYF